MDTNEIIIGDGLAAPETDSAVTIDEAENQNPLPKTARLNDDGSVTFPLRIPVELKWKKAGETELQVDRYTELTMKRLRGADMTAIMGAARKDLGVTSIARATGIPVHKFQHIYDRMDAADITTASAVVSYFLNNGPRTGPSD